MPVLYTAHATTQAGRSGHTRTDDGLIDLQLSRPGDGKGSNPEQLFACGYGACFGSAVESVARSEKVALSAPVAVAAKVSLLKDEPEGYSIAVELDVTLEGVDGETALRLVEKAHGVCPYSKATRGNIAVRLTANAQPVAQAA